MKEYQKIKPVAKWLIPYVEGYVHLRLNDKGITYKDLLPRPGATWIFANAPLWINGELLHENLVLGIHNKPSVVRWDINLEYAFIVKFSSYGLSRFSNVAVQETKNKAITGDKIWSYAVHNLHNRIVNTPEITEQIEMIEEFLVEKFIQPTRIEKSIFQLADTLRNSNDCISLNDLKRNVPLSTRQLERKFRELVGFNIQTYNRICHFDYAKFMIIEQQHASLTNIGYQAGYFDQPHFSKEFRRLTNFQPTKFLQYAPFYKYLSRKSSA